LFDLIPYYGQQYAKAIAGVLLSRQNHWTKQLPMNPILAGTIADAEYKGQAAAKLMVDEEDTTKCQNHKLKKVYEVVETKTNFYKLDFLLITEVASYFAANVNIQRELSSHQRINELAELSLFLYNDTRWESRYQVLKRFLELKESIVEIFRKKGILLEEWREKVSDFLDDAFFERCRKYLVFLKEMNRVSLFYQTQKFPTGCFVPLMILYLMDLSKPNKQMDAPYLLDFKNCLYSAIKEYMYKPILTTKNNFLKAALLHPGVAKIVFNKVGVELINECFDSILTDALSMENVEKEHQNDVLSMENVEKENQNDEISFLTPSINYYRNTIINTSTEFPNVFPWKDLNKNGLINEFSHMEFWKDVALKGINFNKGKCAHILKAASMILAQPAGESIDESTFSSVGNTMRKDRLSLTSMKIEQITIIRMFIRNFKWEPITLHQWFETQMANQIK